MIYPTRLTLVLAALCAPLVLGAALAAPAAWYGGLVLLAMLGAVILIDAVSGIGPRAVEAWVEPPRTAPLGEEFEVPFHIRFNSRRYPDLVELALAGDPMLAPLDGAKTVRLEGPAGQVLFGFMPERRGTAQFPALWVRWRGSLGLVWKQRRVDGHTQVAILADVQSAHRRASEMFKREGLHGLMAQVRRGVGTEFDALVEFQPGMDRRAIDWKQSARHGTLNAKEYQLERNNQIVFAINAGRQMTDPLAGMPRLDRAIAAVLQNAWIALRLGDRAALFSFDSQPRVASGFVAGPRAFGNLQRVAAAVDYSTHEPNYTYALATLERRLKRRSMIVLVTEFTDTTSADFLVEAASRLLRKHLVMVVVLRDEDLEAFAMKIPEEPDDVTRAVTAAALLRERLLVLTRLSHLGATVVESAHDQLGDAMSTAYLQLKQRNLL